MLQFTDYLDEACICFFRLYIIKGEKMLLQKVKDTINNKNLIQKNDIVVVGVSGGPDSICLLHILLQIQKDLDFKIYVAHINHGIREEAKSDAEYVRKFCAENHIEFYLKEINVIQVSKNEKISTEEAGRKVRYSFFEDILNKVNGNKIATAHTASDNAETILMNLMRGTGTTGLKGIQPKRNNKYIRPLIECNRKEIEEYCKNANLNPRHDKTNDENIYTRNKIRNILIPFIEKEFNPNFVTSLNRLSEIVSTENEYLDQITDKIYKEILINKQKDQIVLDLKKFNNQETVIKNRIIRYTITQIFGTSQSIEKKHISDIIKLCDRNIGNKFLIPNKKIKILVKNKKIFFISNVEYP